ncbi:2-oxoglutarate dehydrogenase E1 component [Mucisphaera calidilacus]|uniref:2-oxoglutarate dehydrogenase E1 component n=1 Tax=Mucisphaera calidilacus TaxID=2527982 RepID=A0A518BTG8_9BACT|nr:2-oxoglutarate dehydrogenase E1 component [Mucisphaera calidilacus]QDU70272.1 2-oxoglutarate dehydrogenase E1 component [Mucisphaera calidilacus]
MGSESEQTLLDSASLAYAESLYEQYITDPGSVPEDWAREFETWRNNGLAERNTLNPGFEASSLFHAGPSAGVASEQSELSAAILQHGIDRLVRNYRVRGHIIASINPLGGTNPRPDELSLDYYGLSEADLNRQITSSTLPGKTRWRVNEVIELMEHTYARAIGAQFMHIDNLEVREWLQRRMESTRNTVDLARKEQIRILTRLTDAVIFEEFIQKKFIGAKSFSLEGAESLIPLLDLTLEKAGDQGIVEVVLGMAHRGRLNVLHNIVGKSAQRIFREFEDIDPKLYLGGGDVKYHLGYSGTWRTRAGQNVHLSLCFNPSHLEFVNPVALGRLRAKQDRADLGTRGERSMCLQIHGDASFAGEGVVQETLNLSGLEGYATGGTLHVILNNQIGFTTSPRDGRSTRYASDVAKMLQIPIFHVNGENPEAVAQVVRLAMDFRMEFKRDVVIDLYCYRRRGHNESDEPAYTQPKLYRGIRERPSLLTSYTDELDKLNGISKSDAERISKRRTELLEKDLHESWNATSAPTHEFELTGFWGGYLGGSEKAVADVETGLPLEDLQRLMTLLNSVPEGFTPHPKLRRFREARDEMAQGKKPLDWASAEALAFASVAAEGHPVRLSGQDCQRGTFSHRHAVLHDAETDQEYCPLQHVAEGQAPVDIYNSPLSEVAVLAFDYGYSLDYPTALVCWEAQFGDFVNVAQVIIDQFIASAEDKWRRLSGITVLLPHGFEGQGPEHSSARLERLLVLTAEHNIQVAMPSTPAQYYHLLRRQAVRPWRKPLFVLTPKSLLRNPACTSPLEDLTTGTYQRFIPDDPAIKPKKARRVLLCAGKIYYDLIARREELKCKDVAICRVEQFYPFKDDMLRELLEAYPAETPVFWVQEEPENMGAIIFMKNRFYNRLFDRHPLAYISRLATASPASGSKAAHEIEQEEILAQAFAGGEEETA